ncbi:ACP S-malonyltransferase [Chlamydiifrater phoenicopteri]|uniref:ACP S-malonyltransferase n=1 Tax=Chlamydiifrater phoenicopteri TaxID=2681469 RepID=UPI001BCDAD2C|nr:ACP S-malonyltransferase [Chlamydiifrater phoenicopteri]
MKEKVAMLFSGQGSQYVGMGEDLKKNYPVAAEVFEKADDILKFNLSSLMFFGPKETLLETANSQLAIYVHGIATLSVIKSLIDINVHCTAGLSLGEYTALTASGAVSFDDVLPLIKMRGQLMNEACLQTSGGMAAVIGLSPEVVEETVSSIGDVWIANYNAPSQIVISGVKEKIDESIAIFKSIGARKVVPLNVFGAFHSPLMQSAEDRLVPYLEELDIRETPIKVISNYSGSFCDSIEIFRSQLLRQITSPTRWYQGCLTMDAECDAFLEVGCGKVLSGINSLIGVTHPTENIGCVKSIEKFLSNTKQ